MRKLIPWRASINPSSRPNGPAITRVRVRGVDVSRIDPHTSADQHIDFFRRLEPLWFPGCSAIIETWPRPKMCQTESIPNRRRGWLCAGWQRPVCPLPQLRYVAGFGIPGGFVSRARVSRFPSFRGECARHGSVDSGITTGQIDLSEFKTEIPELGTTPPLDRVSAAFSYVQVRTQVGALLWVEGTGVTHVRRRRPQGSARTYSRR